MKDKFKQYGFFLGIILIIGVICAIILLLTNLVKGKERVKFIQKTTIKDSINKYTTSPSDKKLIKVKNNKLYINNRYINFDNYVFFEYSDFKIVNDQIIFKGSDFDGFLLFSINKSGDNLYDFSKYLSGSMISSYNINNNSIYITSNDLGQDYISSVCGSKDDKKIIYVEKFTFKNGKYEKELYKYTTVKQYKKQNNITCPNQ